MNDERVQALREALALSPGNPALRLLLAEALVADSRLEEGVAEYRGLCEEGLLSGSQLLQAGQAALRAQQWDLVDALLSRAKQQGIVEGLRSLQAARDEALLAKGVLRLVTASGDDAQSVSPTQVSVVEPRISFEDVGGLEELKKAIHRMIILPYQRPDLYRKYGKKIGGGVLFYGPPGCGKTMLARATAGECGFSFVNVRIEDVLDPYLGVSERNLHELFDRARNRRPCVLFLDELDGIGYARAKHRGSAGRSLVDQLLQELDAIGADNREILVIGATNAPWDVDEGLKRPGRFDRTIFIPPPDAAARAAILQLLLRDRPTADIDHRRIAKSTPLCSGADLGHLVESALEALIEKALDSGEELPLTTLLLMDAAAKLRPTTLEWLHRARNFVEFANQNERYEDIARFLRSSEARAYDLD